MYDLPANGILSPESTAMLRDNLIEYRVRNIGFHFEGPSATEGGCERMWTLAWGTAISEQHRKQQFNMTTCPE
jgi:hypothetical protein